MVSTLLLAVGQVLSHWIKFSANHISLSFAFIPMGLRENSSVLIETLSAQRFLTRFTVVFWLLTSTFLYNSLSFSVTSYLTWTRFTYLFRDISALRSCRLPAHPTAGPSISITSLRSFSCWATATSAAWIISFLAIPPGTTLRLRNLQFSASCSMSGMTTSREMSSRHRLSSI